MLFQCSNELKLVFQVLQTTVVLHLRCFPCEVNIPDELALYIGSLLCVRFSWLSLEANLYFCVKNKTLDGCIYKQCWPICYFLFLNMK